jgi:hypothetical protein
MQPEVTKPPLEPCRGWAGVTAFVGPGVGQEGSSEGSFPDNAPPLVTDPKQSKKATETQRPCAWGGDRMGLICAVLMFVLHSEKCGLLSHPRQSQPLVGCT